jgi:O-acetyl-ADP-ribose deacetylase (regulator of RNase III)
MIYRTGDVFASTCPALGHGVNTLGSMGAGIAVEFRRRWPAMYRAYVQECRSGRLQPGGIFVFQAADRLIVNLATQRGVGRGSARLAWVRAAARQVAQLPLEGLALPRIAAGLGGLAWDDVAAVLEAELAPLPYVEVWSLPSTA